MTERNDEHADRPEAEDATEHEDQPEAENATEHEDQPEAENTDEHDGREPDGVVAEEEAATRHEERAPLDDLSREVRQRRASEEQEPSADELFEEVDVGEIDAERVWETITSEEEAERVEEQAVGAGSEAEKVGSGGPDQRPEHLLPKSEFCGRCPYLTEPPELSCTHEGTDIVEVADVDHFRVRGCPFAVEEEPTFEKFS